MRCEGQTFLSAPFKCRRELQGEHAHPHTMHTIHTYVRICPRELQGVCGATANVEEETLKSGVQKRVISVQGLWDRSISEWLGTRHGLPEACVDNRAAAMKGPGHSQKKEKKATNVRKA